MPENHLTKRIAIVTGGARGIGLAAGRALAQAGAQVLLADIDEKEVSSASAHLCSEGLIVTPCSVDIANSESTSNMVECALKTYGSLDILVNNAAVPDNTPFETLSQERWKNVININLNGAYYCTKAALPALKQSSTAAVVNVASIQGLRGQPDALAYATAKGGVVNLTRCMAVDFGPLGIRVNAVAPGFINTRMAQLPTGGHEYDTQWFKDIFIKHGRLPLRRTGTPEDVAGPIVFLVSDDSRYITGETLVVDGGVLCTF